MVNKKHLLKLGRGNKDENERGKEVCVSVTKRINFRAFDRLLTVLIDEQP
jgi:hypothetical protein